MKYAETTGFHLVCFWEITMLFVIDRKYDKQKMITVWMLVKQGSLLGMEYISIDFLGKRLGNISWLIILLST